MYLRCSNIVVEKMQTQVWLSCLHSQSSLSQTNQQILVETWHFNILHTFKLKQYKVFPCVLCLCPCVLNFVMAQTLRSAQRNTHTIPQTMDAHNIVFHGHHSHMTQIQHCAIIGSRELLYHGYNLIVIKTTSMNK